MMFLSKQLMKHINHKQHFTSIHLIIAYDIAEILLKLALNTNQSINQSSNHWYKMFICSQIISQSLHTILHLHKISLSSFMCYRSQKSTLVSHTKQFNPTYNAINKLFSLYGSKKKNYIVLTLQSFLTSKTIKM